MTTVLYETRDVTVCGCCYSLATGLEPHTVDDKGVSTDVCCATSIESFERQSGEVNISLHDSENDGDAHFGNWCHLCGYSQLAGDRYCVDITIFNRPRVGQEVTS